MNLMSEKRKEQFASDMERAGYAVKEHKGQYGYAGPCVRIESDQLKDVQASTQVALTWERHSSGVGLIVYPNVPSERAGVDKYLTHFYLDDSDRYEHKGVYQRLSAGQMVRINGEVFKVERMRPDGGRGQKVQVKHASPDEVVEGQIAEEFIPASRQEASAFFTQDDRREIRQKAKELLLLLDPTLDAGRLAEMQTAEMLYRIGQHAEAGFLARFQPEAVSS